VLARAHQGAAAQLIGEGGWAHARKYFSLSEKYADWADYRQPARGSGIHAHAHHVDGPIRLTDEELRSHPELREFGGEAGRHPPMRGWLAVPLIGSDGENYGFIQASGRLEVTSPSRTRRTSFVWRRSRPSGSTPWRSCTSPGTGRRSEVSRSV
jgi:GAF domain-containing protein